MKYAPQAHLDASQIVDWRPVTPMAPSWLSVHYGAVLITVLWVSALLLIVGINGLLAPPTYRRRH